MAEAVYIVCAVTSAACAALLIRAYLASRARLLLWSAICFVLLTVNNVLLFVDLGIIEDVDLSAWRAATNLAGLIALLFGLVYDRRPGAGV